MLFVLNSVPKLDTLPVGEGQKPKEAMESLKWYMTILRGFWIQEQAVSKIWGTNVNYDSALQCPNATTWIYSVIIIK